MTTRRYALRDDQWERIKDLLPGREGTVGVTAKDNRFCVSQAMITIAKLGGFLARKSDGDPGSTVIWRGWTVLQNATRLGTRLFP